MAADSSAAILRDDVTEGIAAFPLITATSDVGLHSVRGGEVVPGANEVDGVDRSVRLAKASKRVSSTQRQRGKAKESSVNALQRVPELDGDTRGPRWQGRRGLGKESGWLPGFWG